MSSNYSIILDKGERNEDYIRHIYRAILSWTNSTFSRFIEKSKDDWYTVTEVPSALLINNATEKHNNMIAENNGERNIPRILKLLHSQLVCIRYRKKLMSLKQFKDKEVI